MILFWQFVVLCHFSRHKAVDVTTLNILVMHMTPFFQQKISHYLSNINNYGLMEFYFHFMYCFIKIWNTVIIISQSLFPIFECTYVYIYIYISKQYT